MVKKTPSLRRSIAIVLVSGSLAIGTIASVPNHVHATNFGSAGTPGVTGTTNGVWLTHGFSWVVGKRDLTWKYSDGVSRAIWEEFNPTDLAATSYVASQCNDEVYDVCVYDAHYGDNGINGWNACAGSTFGQHPDQKCSVAWVRINETYDPPEKRIACHEMAHSIGLRHTSEQASCVKRTSDGGDSSQLSPHDEGHINAEY